MPRPNAKDGFGQAIRPIVVAAAPQALKLRREHHPKKLFGCCLPATAGHPDKDNAGQEGPVPGSQPDKAPTASTSDGLPQSVVQGPNDSKVGTQNISANE